MNVSLRCIISLTCLTGCVSALPSQPPEDLIRFAQEAEQAADEASDHAIAARAEFERSELLLEEVRVLLERAEAAERRCASLVEKIPKRSTKRVYRIRSRKPKVAKPAEKTEEEKATELPKYSPSDAPPGANVQPRGTPNAEAADSPSS